MMRLRHVLRLAVDMARLMVGVPSYPAYLRHMRERHPGARPMSYEEFFRDRQQARFSGKGSGGCC